MRTIELADFRAFAAAVRRSTRLRAGILALAVLLAIVACLAAPRSATPPPPLVKKGSTALVVVDVSASISSDTYARIASTLDRLRRGGGKVGLVLFSDTAYQALPPGTPAAELASFERFFVVKQQAQPGLQPQPPHSPWTDTFSAGTRISTGLELALQVIREEQVPHPQVLLISDLDDDTTDLESLTSVALAYRHLGVPIDVAGLNPSPQDAAYMQRLLPHGGSIVDVPLTTQPARSVHLGVPWGLVVVALLLACALGGAFLATQRLEWSRG
jgi:hypothetical protein